MPIYRFGDKATFLYNNGSQIIKAYRYGNLCYQLQPSVPWVYTDGTNIIFRVNTPAKRITETTYEDPDIPTDVVEDVYELPDELEVSNSLSEQHSTYTPTGSSRSINMVYVPRVIETTREWWPVTGSYTQSGYTTSFTISQDQPVVSIPCQRGSMSGSAALTSVHSDAVLHVDIGIEGRGGALEGGGQVSNATFSSSDGYGGSYVYPTGFSASYPQGSVVVGPVWVYDVPVYTGQYTSTGGYITSTNIQGEYVSGGTLYIRHRGWEIVSETESHYDEVMVVELIRRVERFIDSLGEETITSDTIQMSLTPLDQYDPLTGDGVATLKVNSLGEVYDISTIA